MKHFYYLCFILLFMYPTKGAGLSFDIDDMMTNQVQRVRIDVIIPNGFVRHLLLAFTPNDAATDGYDYGYDALNYDDLSNDGSWLIGEQRYNIQGVGSFQNTKAYPLGIFLSDAGDVELELTALEHFENPIEVYIYDSLNQTTTSISNGNFIQSLPAGDSINRFYVTFTSTISAMSFPDNTLSTVEIEVNKPKISYISSTKELQLSVPQELSFQDITLYNILGQKVKQWSNLTSNSSGNYKISLSNFSSGTYLVSLKTKAGKFNKRLIIAK